MEETTVAEAVKKGNPCVFFDVTLGGAPAGRLKMELFKSVAPRTVENFRQYVYRYCMSKAEYPAILLDFFCIGYALESLRRGGCL